MSAIARLFAYGTLMPGEQRWERGGVTRPPGPAPWECHGRDRGNAPPF